MTIEAFWAALAGWCLAYLTGALLGKFAAKQSSHQEME